MNPFRRFLQSGACFISVAVLLLGVASFALMRRVPAPPEPAASVADTNEVEIKAGVTRPPVGPAASPRPTATNAPPQSPAQEVNGHAHQQRIQAAIDADIEMGINAEVRQREVLLVQRAAGLAVGMDRAVVLRLMGPPNEVKIERLFSGGGVIIGSTNQKGEFVFTRNGPREVAYRYSPRDHGVPYNGQNGLGYHILTVRLDPVAESVTGWSWEGDTVRSSAEERLWEKWEDYAEIAKPAP